MERYCINIYYVQAVAKDIRNTDRISFFVSMFLGFSSNTFG